MTALPLEGMGAGGRVFEPPESEAAEVMRLPGRVIAFFRVRCASMIFRQPAASARASVEKCAKNRLIWPGRLFVTPLILKNSKAARSDAKWRAYLLHPVSTPSVQSTFDGVWITRAATLSRHGGYGAASPNRFHEATHAGSQQPPLVNAVGGNVANKASARPRASSDRGAWLNGNAG